MNIKELQHVKDDALKFNLYDIKQAIYENGSVKEVVNLKEGIDFEDAINEMEVLSQGFSFNQGGYDEVEQAMNGVHYHSAVGAVEEGKFRTVYMENQSIGVSPAVKRRLKEAEEISIKVGEQYPAYSQEQAEAVMSWFPSDPLDAINPEEVDHVIEETKKLTGLDVIYTGGYFRVLRNGKEVYKFSEWTIDSVDDIKKVWEACKPQ